MTEKKEGIQKYMPEKIIFDLKHVKTVPECIKSNTPALAELQKSQGEDKTLTLL